MIRNIIVLMFKTSYSENLIFSVIYVIVYNCLLRLYAKFVVIRS